MPRPANEFALPLTDGAGARDRRILCGGSPLWAPAGTTAALGSGELRTNRGKRLALNDAGRALERPHSSGGPNPAAQLPNGKSTKAASAAISLKETLNRSLRRGRIPPPAFKTLSGILQKELSR